MKGETFIFPFNESISYYQIFDHFTPIRLVDEQRTQTILNHFQGKRNIVDDCVKEIKKLDEKNKTCKVSTNEDCEYKNNGCLRFLKKLPI